MSSTVSEPSVASQVRSWVEAAAPGAILDGRSSPWGTIQCHASGAVPSRQRTILRRSSSSGATSIGNTISERKPRYPIGSRTGDGTRGSPHRRQWFWHGRILSCAAIRVDFSNDDRA